jgi:hypothetical protein
LRSRKHVVNERDDATPRDTIEGRGKRRGNERITKKMMSILVRSTGALIFTSIEEFAGDTVQWRKNAATRAAPVMLFREEFV